MATQIKIKIKNDLIKMSATFELLERTDCKGVVERRRKKKPIEEF